MPGQSDIELERNSIQTLVATKRDNAWHLMAFYDTWAQFLGRPELVQQLTAELRQKLSSVCY